MIQSPLNYIGGKYKLLPQILPLFPAHIDTFVDMFCGGLNVGINVKADKYLYNDTNMHLLCLYNTFKNLGKKAIYEWIYQIITDYGLSNVSKYGYDYYGCNSSKGLGEYNKKSFLKLRNDFNQASVEDYRYYVMFYVIVVYAFNNQIRFNSKGEYNLPVGKRDFNSKMSKKLSDFIDILHSQDCRFFCKDFREFKDTDFKRQDFIYADPPYLITCATYNEKAGWTEQDEIDLLDFLDSLHENGIRFALSNVLSNKGKKNTLLLDWIERNSDSYKVIELNYSYANSNYHSKDKTSSTREVLIINY